MWLPPIGGIVLGRGAGVNAAHGHSGGIGCPRMDL